VIRESEREYYFNSYEGLSTDHFKMADSIVFVSNATRNIYADLEYNGNFTTIYNGIDIRRIEDFKKLNKKEELKKQYNFSNNDTVITVVGTTCERKGQKYFMEAAINILKTTNRSDLQFLVVGARDIPYLQELVEMVENSGYKDNIHFIKETDKVFSYYLISDIFACTSLVESLPRVILEAMAFELPIIASNIYGVPEEIEDKKSGILVKAGDAVELSNQILNLIENKDMARDLARNAFLSVKTKFGVAEMTDNYESLIKSIME
jgi:glycosyltransferase involved in cell wall biosynthesis